MSSFKKKQNDKYVLKKSDIDFYRMTGVFAVACVFILLVLKMKDTGLERIASGRNLTYNFYVFCHTPLFAVISLAVLAAAAAWFIYCRKKKVNEAHRVFSSSVCLSLVLYLIFFCGCFGLFPQSALHSFFIVSTIALALLFYTSKIYNADFVAYSLVTFLMAASVYLWGMRFEPYMVILKLTICAATVAFCVIFKKKSDFLSTSRRRKTPLLAFPCYVAAALGIVFLFWAYFQNLAFFRESELLMKIQSAIFLNRSIMLCALFVQYIVFAIIFTVRRIKD